MNTRIYVPWYHFLSSFVNPPPCLPILSRILNKTKLLRQQKQTQGKISHSIASYSPL